MLHGLFLIIWLAIRNLQCKDQGSNQGDLGDPGQKLEDRRSGFVVVISSVNNKEG